MEAVQDLDGCLSIGKNVGVPTFVALFYILQYTSLNGVYFSLEYCGVEPKNEAMVPSQAPSLHSSTSAFIGHGSVCVPDQAPFVVWVEPILPFAFVRELDHEWLVVYISQKYPVRPPSVGWVLAPYSEIYWCDRS